MGALAIEVVLGFLTFTASLMAFGKLQESLPQRPITYRGQNVVNLGILALAIGTAVYLIVTPRQPAAVPPDGGPRPGLRRAPHHPHRRRGHAHGDLPPQRLRGPLRLGHGLRPEQQAPDHRRRPGRQLRPHPLHHHVQGHEPVLRQRALRCLRPGPGRRGARGTEEPPERHRRGGRQHPGERRLRHHRPRLRHGRGPGPAQGAGALRPADASTASTCGSPSTPWPGACRAT